MDTRTRKRLQEMRSMTNEQLLARQAEILIIGMEQAKKWFNEAMKEEKRISGPMIDRINERVDELAYPSNTGDNVDKVGDNSNG